MMHGSVPDPKMARMLELSDQEYKTARITIAGLLREISITSDMQMTPPSWQKVKKN